MVRLISQALPPRRRAEGKIRPFDEAGGHFVKGEGKLRPYRRRNLGIFERPVCQRARLGDACVARAMRNSHRIRETLSPHREPLRYTGIEILRDKTWGATHLE